MQVLGVVQAKMQARDFAGAEAMLVAGQAEFEAAGPEASFQRLLKWLICLTNLKRKAEIPAHVERLQVLAAQTGNEQVAEIIARAFPPTDASP